MALRVSQGDLRAVRDSVTVQKKAPPFGGANAFSSPLGLLPSQTLERPPGKSGGEIQTQLLPAAGPPIAIVAARRWTEARTAVDWRKGIGFTAWPSIRTS